MKKQSKPIIALAAGATLLFGALCQTTQGQSIIIPTATIELPDANGIVADYLAVTYEVTQDTLAGQGNTLYNYDYSFVNPSPATVNVFNVTFNSTPGNTMNITGGFLGESLGSQGINWVLNVAADGGSSGSLAFQSPLAPTYGLANASGAPNPPGSWGSDTAANPAGPEVPVPMVPEPGTIPLLAIAGLLVLVVQPNFLKRA
jgi:hypothetical protein